MVRLIGFAKVFVLWIICGLLWSGICTLAGKIHNLFKNRKGFFKKKR